MPRSQADRKKLFRVALLLNETTQDEWARQREITGGHVSQVLAGRESRKLTQIIDDYIDETLRAHRVRGRAA